MDDQEITESEIINLESPSTSMNPLAVREDSPIEEGKEDPVLIFSSCQSSPGDPVDQPSCTDEEEPVIETCEGVTDLDDPSIISTSEKTMKMDKSISESYQSVQNEFQTDPIFKENMDGKLNNHCRSRPPRPPNEYILWCQHKMAEMHMTQNNVKEAVGLFLTIYETYKNDPNYGPLHPTTMASQLNYLNAKFYLAFDGGCGDLENAIKIFEECFELKKKLSSPPPTESQLEVLEKVHRARVSGFRAIVLLKQGKTDQAYELYGTVFQTFYQFLGQHHHETLHAFKMGELLWQKYYSDTENGEYHNQVSEGLLDTRDASFGKDHENLSVNEIDVGTWKVQEEAAGLFDGDIEVKPKHERLDSQCQRDENNQTETLDQEEPTEEMMGLHSGVRRPSKYFETKKMDELKIDESLDLEETAKTETRLLYSEVWKIKEKTLKDFKMNRLSGLETYESVSDRVGKTPPPSPHFDSYAVGQKSFYGPGDLLFDELRREGIHRGPLMRHRKHKSCVLA